MAFLIHDLIGAQPIANTETTARHALGTKVTAYDSSYGQCEFIYLLGVASTIVGSMVTWDITTYQTTLSPTDTSGNGSPVAFAMSANVAAQYGWYQVKGMAVAAKTAVAIAPGAVVMVSGTAGKVYATDSAGKQVLGAQFSNAATIASATGTIAVNIMYPHLER